MPQTVVVERDGAIATVVLNRPEKLNAINKPMWQELGAAIAVLSDDDEVRCVVLRGAGGKAFAPGADIKEFETTRASRDLARDYNALVERTIGTIAACRHPTIALIE
ncbi:MAG: enoyl-CoA hydratase/isomerase family protein, partial [Alphaproteobacteria bacterium]